MCLTSGNVKLQMAKMGYHFLKDRLLHNFQVIFPEISGDINNKTNIVSITKGYIWYSTFKLSEAIVL